MTYTVSEAAQKATDLCNEFISDQQELHGHNQATRDEAYQTLSLAEQFAKDITAFGLKHFDYDFAEWTLKDAISAYARDIEGNPVEMIACLVQAEVEKAKANT